MTEAGIEAAALDFAASPTATRSDVDESAVALLDVVRSIAFVGDLAMGQPTDHSPRAAWMAGQLAAAAGADEADCTQATTVALLRWSGCTANAPEFAQFFGDDVSGRKALLAIQSSTSGFRSGTRRNASAFLSLSRIHCEVAGDVAVQLGLDAATQFHCVICSKATMAAARRTACTANRFRHRSTWPRSPAISTSSIACTVSSRHAR